LHRTFKTPLAIAYIGQIRENVIGELNGDIPQLFLVQNRKFSKNDYRYDIYIYISL